MPKITVYITISHKDKKGRNIIEKRKKVHSYVIALLDVLNICQSQVARTVKDITGTDRSHSTGSYTFGANAAAGITILGIVVGTGTTPVAISDYKLQMQIPHGTGSGQLQYGAMSVSAPYTVGSTRKYDMSRTFTNASGADITVNEVGLYVYGHTTAYTYCDERTLLTFTVPNGQSKTVTYTVSVTV